MSLVALVLVNMLAMARTAQAQGYPAEMVITLPEVDVRSGPTPKFYATSKVRYGDRVLVVKESKDQPGWLGIKPPPDSFSWINDKYVKQIDARTGIVIGSDGAVLLAGSAITNKAPDVESVKIPQGSIITILNKGKTADGLTWLPIQPWPTEVRWIAGESVQTRQLASNNNVTFNGPAATTPAGNPLIIQADQAYQAGNIEKAKQLYKDAAEKTADYSQKIYCYNRLSSLTQSPWNPGQTPGHPAQMAQGIPSTIGQTASFSQSNPAPASFTSPLNWSPVGILRRATFDKDGQPTYVLEDLRGKGQVLLYITCQPGMTLRDYVGRTVALYGSVNYRSDAYVRSNYMLASHVAVY